MPSTTTAGRMLFAFTLAMLFIAVAITALWIRSYKLNDVANWEGIVIVSVDPELLVGKSEQTGMIPKHDSGPVAAGGNTMGGWIWLLYVGDVEPADGFGWENFLVAWRNGNAPFWCEAFPIWPFSVGPGAFVIFAAIRRWFGHRMLPARQSRLRYA